MNLKNKKGVSMVVLVIVIIVMIILAGTVIMSLQDDNPILESKQSRFKANLVTMRAELSEKVSKEVVNNVKIEKEDIDVYAYDEIIKYIPSFPKKYENELAIIDGELVFIGEDEDNRKWAEDVDVGYIEVENIPRPSDDPNPGELEVKPNEHGTDEYYINSIEDLVRFSKDCDKENNTPYKYKRVYLGRTLDFKYDGSYRNPNRRDFGDLNSDVVTGTIKEECNTGTGFPRINYIDCSFDGQNYTILNFNKNIDSGLSECSNNFIDSNWNSIKNLNVKGNIKINNTNLSQNFGLVRNNYKTIENCKVDFIVESINSNINDIGLLAEANDGKINNCHSYGNIKFNIV